MPARWALRGAGSVTDRSCSVQRLGVAGVGSWVSGRGSRQYRLGTRAVAEIEPDEESNVGKTPDECSESATERDASTVTAVDAQPAVSAAVAPPCRVSVPRLAVGGSDRDEADEKPAEKMGEMKKERAEKLLKDLASDVGEHGMRCFRYRVCVATPNY